MYTVTDVSGIADFSQKIFMIERSCFAFDCWSESSINDILTNPNYTVLVCCNDSEIVGYLNASVIFDEAELNRIAVLPQHRGKGAAIMLLDFLKKALAKKRISLVRLEVRASNKIAISLYNSQGFEIYALRKNYYDNPTEDALMMSLEL